MYEFSHGGLWFRWSALSTREKLLLCANGVSTIAAIAPATILVGDFAYGLGFRVGSGGLTPPGPAPTFTPWMLWWTLGFAVLSGITYWRFARLQDELFNRLHGWIFAVAGLVTVAITTIWGLAGEAGVAPQLPGIASLVVFLYAVIPVALIAYRRWL